VRALDIEVRPELVDRWLGWFVPVDQPFLVPNEIATRMRLTDDRDRLTMEHRDTFALYSVDEDESVVWLDEEQASTLPRSVRRAQPLPHRWPSEPLERQLDLLIEYVEDGRRPSRHTEVPGEVWEASARLLPCARLLAGCFPARSGPNCFGAVMAAAGVAGAAEVWMQREPFEAWLADNTRRGGDDADPGTVLVWRDPEGAVQHAAVTLGGGWALHKPSQGWMSPTKVLTVAETKASSRAKGRRLHRYTLG